MGRLARQGTLCILAMALAGTVQAQPAAQIQGITPTEVRPGGLVTIRGVGFGSDRRAVRVQLGSVAVPVRAVSPRAIQFTVPPQAQSGAVVVTVAGQQLPGPPLLRVLRPLRLASVRPARGAPGTEVTLAGEGFDVPPSQNRVTLSGVACRVTGGSGASLTIVVPEGARTGTFTVVNAGGQRAVSSPFTVVGAPATPTKVSGRARPTIDRLEPLNGPPGTVVRILGRNFERGSRVFLNDRPLRVTEAQATRLIVEIPQGSRSGPLSVRGRYNVTSRERFVVENRPLPPRINSFSPEAGAPGLQVTLRGERFAAQVHRNQVTLAGQPCVVRRASPSRLVVEVPQGVSVGRFVVRVPGAGEAASAREFTAWPELQVTSVEPLAAPVGARVTVRGQGFAPTLAQNRLTLNGRALRLAQAGPTELVFVVPARATSGPVEVQVRGMRRRAPRGFVVTTPPVLRRFVPTAGAPGTEVTLSGRNMGTAPGELTVRLGGRDCPVLAARGTSVAVRIPPGAQTGRFEVIRRGQGSATSQGVFTAYVPVSISDFAPHRVAAGGEVVVRGTGFAARLGANKVLVGGQRARVVAAGPEELRFAVPAGATGGTIRVEVRGRGMADSARELVVRQPPVISGFSPARGEPGTVVTLRGQHLGRNLNKVRVTLAGRPCPVTSVGPQQITLTVPEGAASGPFEVAVGRRGSASSARSFQVIRPLRLTGFIPVQGPPGTEVVLRGEGFASKVKRNTVHLGSTRVKVLAAGPSELRVKIPRRAASGSFKVTVRSRRGPREVQSAKQFNVTNRLRLDRMVPDRGAPGTEVTLHGHGFRQKGLTVLLGGRPVNHRVRSAEQLVLMVPPGYVSGPITLRLPAGVEVSSGRSFMVAQPTPTPPKRVAVRPGARPRTKGPAAKRVVVRPGAQLGPLTVRSFSPAAGPAGTVVQLQGTGFGRDVRLLQVWLGTTGVPIVSLQGGSLTVRVPPNARGGPWRVRRNDPAGPAEALSRGPFQVRPPRR